jgi:hypothetical protein
VLWDCIALIDDATVDLLKGLGGVAAIAVSHPHYYNDDGGVEPRTRGVPDLPTTRPIVSGRCGRTP